MVSIKGNAEEIYINEVIRITYKCNWNCKFCNVYKTNNFGENDVSYKEVIYQILNLINKYTKKQREMLILSFSGGEPTLNKNLQNYIKLAKKIGVGIVEIQTNGTRLFIEHEYIIKLIKAGLDEIFLAQHSSDNIINKKLGSFLNVDDFISWTNFILKKKINRKIRIYLNIVVSKINIYNIKNFINFLINIGFIKIIPTRTVKNKKTRKISFGFVQPNGYADINRDEVLLKYTYNDIKEIKKIVEICEENNILPDFHFVCPPLCILNYNKYNLEYKRLKKLEKDDKKGYANKGNLKAYKLLWKEKIKFNECKKCKYNNYCLGFYKNWVDFVGEEYVKGKINKFLK